MNRWRAQSSDATHRMARAPLAFALLSIAHSTEALASDPPYDCEEERRRRTLIEIPRALDCQLGWADNARAYSYGPEVAVSGLVGAHVTRPGGAAGQTIRLGLRRAFFGFEPENDRLLLGMKEAVFWDYWGIDARVHATRGLGRFDDHDSLLAFGVATTLYNVLGARATSRVRIPSLAGIVLPELGIAHRGNGTSSPYTAHALPVAFLFRDDIGMELAANAFVFYRSDVASPDVLVALSLGLLYRGPTPRVVVW